MNARLPLACLLGALVVAQPVLAQGRSDSAPGRSGGRSRAAESGLASPVTAVGETSVPAVSPTSAAYYGTWLDDASAMTPGVVWIGLASGYWRGGGYQQIDAPVAAAAVGMTGRFMAGGNVSFYHFRDPLGSSETGTGSASLYGKLVLFDPSSTSNRVGLAVTPLVELSPGAADRVGWAMPVNVEVRRDSARFYGSAGYFSRGSAFATAAIEVPVAPTAALTATFGQSYARAGSHQTSIGLGAVLTLTPATAVFVGIGQTFTPDELGPGGLSLAGGLSFLVPNR